MAVHKLLDDFDDNEFTLIAIHSHLEDYRLAYFINQHLGVQLQKTSEVATTVHSSFSNYEWMDEQQDILWNLVANVTLSNKPNEQKAFSLFDEGGQLTKEYLIPEMKKVDYFLKIDAEEIYVELSKNIKKIQRIPNIITTYKVDTDQLKSRINLIF